MLALVTVTVVSAQGFWTTLPSMPTARAAQGSAAAPCPKGLDGTCLYSVGGGDNGSGIFAMLEAYSPKSNTWVTLPSMPTARASLAAAAAPCPQGLQGTCLYAVGGFDGSTFVATLEAYSPKSNTWVTLPSMPTARSGLAAATAPCPQGVKGTCLYAAGGFDVANPNGAATVEAYSPRSNSWMTVPSMPTGHGGAAAAAVPCPQGLGGTCLDVVGGFDGSNAVGTFEGYSPESNSWTTLPSMPTARFRLGAAAAPCPQGVKGTCLFAVGGQTNGLGLHFVEAYSPKSNSWLTLPTMPTGRQRLAAVAAPCTNGIKGTCVYAVGGVNPSGVLGTLEMFVP
jgi:hypothetical protein